MPNPVTIAPTKQAIATTTRGGRVQTHHGKLPRPIGVLLRTYRRVHHRGVRGLAHEIKISAATLSRIERGYEFDARTWHRLCGWLLGPTR